VDALVIAGAAVVIRVAAAVIATLVGARLPVAHRAARTEVFAQPPERLWEAIADPSDTRRGGVAFETVESRPPQRLVRKVVGERAFGGTWTYEIEPRGIGSALTVTEDGEIYNAFFRFMSKYVIGHHRTIDGYMKELRRRFGEI
jgi:hypothetical protein